MNKSPALVVAWIGLLLATNSVAQPFHLWSQQYGSTGDNFGNAVAIDASDNLFLSGTFQGTVNFGGSDLVAASNDIFLAKYTAAGAHQWSKRFGSTSFSDKAGIAVDAAGNVFLVGFFTGTANFGGLSLVSAGLEDIFLVKLSPNGAHKWSKRFGSTSADKGYGVAVDGSGNVIVVGSFQGSVNFGGSSLTSVGLEDIFVAKYNSSGAHQWSQRFGGSNSDNGYAVSVDGTGNVIATGSFRGTVNFGGSNLTSASAGIEDIFVAKYSSAGAHQWSQRFGSAGLDLGDFIACDNLGGIVVTGQFENTVNFGGGNLVSAGDRDLFVAKYNSAGAHQWSRRFGSTGLDLGTPLAVDAAGNAIVSGAVSDATDFGGGSLPVFSPMDAFIAKYSANGAYLWSRIFNGSSDDGSGSIAVDGSGRIAMTGRFGDEVSFGGERLESKSAYDIFLAMFGPTAAEPDITSINDIGNDQGRQVKIRFNRSGVDDKAAPTPVTRYEAYRRDDAPPSLADRRNDPAGLSERQLRDIGWTQVGTVAAHNQASYGIDVPTVGDSTLALGPYRSVFFVRAAKNEPSEFFDSPIDSGYSIDNLAPGIPPNFAYSTNILTWDKSTAADFDYFSIYGSNTNSFATATLIDYTVATTMNVSASPYVFYFATATDFSGNEGKAAIVNTLSGVGGPPRSYVLSLSAYPNPFNPTTTVRYTVSSPGPVTISIYDLHGVRVATLVNREMKSGAYSVAWDGRDAHGQPVSAGVYFGRLTSATGSRTYKMTLVK